MSDHHRQLSKERHPGIQKSNRGRSAHAERAFTLSDRLMQMQHAVGNRVVMQWMKGQLSTGDEPIQLKKAEPTRNPQFTLNDGRASHVDVVVYGTTHPKNHNRPTVDPPGWDLIKENYEISPSNELCRMHLWNGRLGGPGNDAKNLCPGLSTNNVAMASEEVMMQNKADEGKYIQIDTDVTYGLSTEKEDAKYYLPNHLKLSWTSYEDKQLTNVGERGGWDQDLELPGEKDWEVRGDELSSYHSDESYEEFSFWNSQSDDEIVDSNLKRKREEDDSDDGREYKKRKLKSDSKKKSKEKSKKKK